MQLGIILDSLFSCVPASYQAPSLMMSTECRLPSSIPPISNDTILLQQSVISYLDRHSCFLAHLIISHLFSLQFILLKCHLTGLQEILIFHSLTCLQLLLSQSGNHTPPQSRQSIFPNVSLISLPNCSYILNPPHQGLAPHLYSYAAPHQECVSQSFLFTKIVPVLQGSAQIQPHP